MLRGSPHERFDHELAAAARDMQDEGISRQAMERAVTIATQILPGCDAAGVCVELKEGPCLDALRQQDTVQSDDLSIDERWPKWGPASAQEVESLEKALGGRTVIGQATGILMERFDLTPDRAFGLLSKISQNRNLKLRPLAEQIVRTRSLPQG